ncbi:hypothetical protein ACFLTO_04045 [Chloroflexota bacterium]
MPNIISRMFAEKDKEELNDLYNYHAGRIIYDELRCKNKNDLYYIACLR